MKPILTIIFSFLVLAMHRARAQEFREAQFTRYTTTHGLSDNNVSGIAQDQSGFIWLSTLSGLNRYNGIRFVRNTNVHDSTAPASTELTGMTWLDKERLALLGSGLHIVNTRTGTSRNLFVPYHDKKFQYKFNVIMAATGDEKGNTFILTRSGFYHFDKNFQLAFRFDYYSSAEVASEHFVFGRELLHLDSSRLLITSIAGLYIYDINKRIFKPLTAADCPPLASFLNYRYQFSRFFQVKPGVIVATIISTDSILYLDIPSNRRVVSKTPLILTGDVVHFRSRMLSVSDSVLYLTGHVSGFYKLNVNPSTGHIDFRPEHNFPDQLCNSVFVDRDKNLWVGTNKGLFRQNKSLSNIQVVPIPPNLETEFPNIRLDAIYTSKNLVFAGARSRGGLLVFDKKTTQFLRRHQFRNYPSFENNVYEILPIGNDRVILATDGPMILFDVNNNSETNIIPPGWGPDSWTGTLFRDPTGKIWIGSDRNFQYDLARDKFVALPDAGMPAIPVAFHHDKNGNIWIAGHGLARFNVQTRQIDQRVDSFPSIVMMDKQIGSMLIDKQNNIWFSSANNGLIRYNIDNKTYRHFTRADGLPDDNVASMIVVDHTLWVACYSGLAAIDLQQFTVRSFGNLEGLPREPVLKSSDFYYDEPERKLYIGFHNSWVRFDPEGLLSIRTGPSLFIENLEFGRGDHYYLPADKVSTTWKNNDLMVTIGSINFSDGANQAFAYRVLSSRDTQWHILGSQSSFSISNLASGDHRIQVKAFSLHNRWPEQVREIEITVQPPFWEKTWFRVFVAAFTVIFIYLFVQWRTSRIRKKEMEKTQVEKLKADDYKNRYELEQISNYFSSSLTDKKTPSEVLWDVAKNLIGRMNYVDCMIYLWNEDKTKMVQQAAYGPKGKPEFIANQVFDVIPGQGVVGHVIETRQPVLIRDTRKDKRYRVDEAFRLSEICVPIIHNNELLGIIDSEHHEPYYFTERDIKILTTIATLIGNKLKQLESEQTLAIKQKELVNINEQLAEAKLSALQAQMNPHFVFNALNSIKRMILDGDNEKASRYLSKFALMIRMTLNHSRDAFVTLAENIEYLKTYLEMEQLRFDGSFTWEIRVADNIDREETLIPSLMIQPLTENAIWHGLMPSEDTKRLLISFARNEKQITCVIEDNGIGINRSKQLKLDNKSTHRSVGLDNIRNRINILNEKYNTDCKIQIIDLGEINEQEHGTRVTLQFNLSYT